MPGARDTVFSRIGEFSITLNAAADTLAVDNIRLFRGRQYLDANDFYEVPFTGGAAGTSPKEVELSTVMPPVGVFRFKFSAF